MWTLNLNPYKQTKYLKPNRIIKYIVLHCTAGPQNQSVASIQAYWRSLGWKKDGYHHIILLDGDIVDLVNPDEPSNGVKGFNANSINICYIGGVELVKKLDPKGRPINVPGKAVDNRTDEQKASQKFLVRMYHNWFPDAKILGHRDFSEDKNRDGVISPDEWMKTCPSFSVKEWLKTFEL